MPTDQDDCHTSVGSLYPALDHSQPVDDVISFCHRTPSEIKAEAGVLLLIEVRPSSAPCRSTPLLPPLLVAFCAFNRTGRELVARVATHLCLLDPSPLSSFCAVSQLVPPPLAPCPSFSFTSSSARIRRLVALNKLTLSFSETTARWLSRAVCWASMDL